MKAPVSRHKVNLISAISPRGRMRFMATKESVISDVFIEFLKRLMHNAQCPIFLKVENHSIPRSGKVREFVKGRKSKPWLFYLPPYSPELNQDEQVWNYLKNHKIGHHVAKGGFELSKRVDSVMRSLQKLPGKIKSFFRPPWTQCMAINNRLYIIAILGDIIRGENKILRGVHCPYPMQN